MLPVCTTLCTRLFYTLVHNLILLYIANLLNLLLILIIVISEVKSETSQYAIGSDGETLSGSNSQSSLSSRELLSDTADSIHVCAFNLH